MNCEQYIADYVSADADGELNPTERLAVRQHLQGCPNCSARIEQERMLKRLIGSRVEATRTPPELAATIIASIDRLSAQASARRARSWKPVLASLAVAAMVVVMLMLGRAYRRTDNPAFDQAVSAFAAIETSFTPNVPSKSVPSLTEHYRTHVDFPAYVWDFSRAGFTLTGGRIDHLADGRTVTYTLYQGSRGALLCEHYKAQGMSIPAGGQEVSGLHHVYSYQGYTICFTIDGDTACLLVSRMPQDEFCQALMEAEGAA